MLSTANVSGLQVKWTVTTASDVSATPAVDADTVYVPDWAGNLYAVDRATGAVKWTASIPLASGAFLDKARATPAVTDDKVIVGTQGGVLVRGRTGREGARVQQVHRCARLEHPGRLALCRDRHPVGDRLRRSGVCRGGIAGRGACRVRTRVCVVVPGEHARARPQLRRDSLEDLSDPCGYPGNAVWGSSPAIDTKRGQVYIATGNNYTAPQSALDCIAAAATPAAQRACLPADDYFDSVLALDMKTGAIKWATQALPFDTWNVDCIPFIGDGSACPEPAGPDFDFGQAPALFTTKDGKGKSIESVGAGQKSGQYWALDPTTGATKWVTQAGPGGTAGGLQWGSAVDESRVYTANANSNAIPWALLGGGTTTNGVWSGINAATGQLLWQHTPSFGGGTSGPVTTANGVVYGCSLDPQGHMYALNGATGAELWSFASGGSCLSGAAISDGTLYWGSGYSNFGFGTPNNKLYAFSLP